MAETTTHPLMAAIATMPHTHKVTTIKPDGEKHEHTTRNAASAENYAKHMRFCFAGAAVTVSEIAQ